MAIDNNWGNKSDLEHARDYDWQGNLINFTSQFSVDALLSGDVFNADKWADAFSFNNGRESLNETQANSYLSYAPTQAQNITRGIASSIGNMLPSMAFAGITGGSSLAPMAVGAFASQTNEAYKESGDFGRSALSGLLSAGIEVGTELLVGKGLKAVGLGTNKVMGVFGKSASGGTSSFIKDFLKTMNEEGAEELVSALCQPLVDSIYKGSDAFNSNEGNSTVYLDKGFWFGKEDSVLTQYLSGAVSGGIMGGASLATQYKTFSKTGVNLINELEDLHKQIATGDETKIAEGTAKVIALMQAFNENSTSSQKSAVLEFLGNPRASIEILSANELESKLSDISDSLESNNNLIYGLDLYRTINRNFLTGYDLSFEDNLANNENAYIDNQNGKIVIRKDLQSGVSKALAHEILGHVVMNSLGKDFVDGTYNKVIKTGWYEKNKDRLDQAYKEKLIVGSNSYKQEVIANYLESFLAVDEAKTSSIVEEVLNKKGFIKRFASLMRGNDVTKFLKTNSIASEYLKSIQKLAGNGLNGNFLDAIQRVKNGYALTQYQRENFGDLINLLQYSIKFNQNLGDTTVDKIKIDLPTKFSGAFLSKYKKSFNIKIPKELSHYTKRPTDYISLYECLDFTDASNEMFTEGLAESKLLNAVDGSNPEFNNKGIVKFTWEGKEYGNKDLTGYKIYATIDTDNHTLLGYSYKNPEGKRLDFLIHHEDYIDDTGFNIWDVREESKKAVTGLAITFTEEVGLDDYAEKMRKYIPKAKEMSEEIKKAMNISYGELGEGIGGFTFTDSEQNQNISGEPSFPLNFNDYDDIENVKLFSYLMGDLAYETQNAVYVWEYTDAANSENVEIAIPLKTINKKLISYIRDYCEGGFSLGLKSNTIYLRTTYDTETGKTAFGENKETEYNRIINFVAKLKEGGFVDETRRIKQKDTTFTNGSRISRKNFYDNWLKDRTHRSKEALSSLVTRAKEVNDYILNQVDSSGEVPEGVTRNSNEISKILNESKVQNSNILDFGEGEIKEQNLKYFNELSSEDKSKIQEFSNEKLFADLLKTDKFSKYTSKDINLIHNNYLYFNALSEEAKADVMKISEGKYAFAEVASWKLFTNCSESDFKKLVFASEGNELTYDEMIELDVTKYLEKYIVEHPRMKAEDYPELIEKIKKEFIEQEITSKDIQKGKKALLVYGLPGAGKSTGDLTNFKKSNNALEFDNDIMKALPCLSEYYQDGLGAGTVQGLVGGAQEELWATVLKGYNIVYPAVGKKLSKVKHEIFRLTEKGYEVELAFVDVTNQTSCNRALYRALQSGRYVSLSYIHNELEEQPSRVYNEISKEIEQYGGIKDYANDRTINIKGIRKYDKRAENRASSSNSQRAQSQGVGSERSNVSENIQIRRANGHSGDAIGTPDSERISSDVRGLQLTPESSAQNTTATEIVRKPKDYYKLFADVHLDTKFDYTEAQKIVYATLNLLSIDNNIELDNDNFKTTINELFEKLNTLDSEARENYLKEVAHKTALAYAEENNTAVSEEIESAILSTMETVIDDFGSQTFNSKMNDRMQYLANVINNLRERARLVAKINKSFNSFRNSITKAKAKNLTTQDIVLNSSFYTDFQKRNPISKSGMSLTPSAIKNVYNLGEFYTAEKMEGSFYGFDENIRNSIDEVMSVIDALAQKAEGTYIPKFNGEHLDFSDEATSNWLSHIEMPVKVMEDYNNLLQFVIQKYNEHRVENTEKAKETASKSHDILTQIASKSKRSAWKDKVAAIRNTAINLPSVIANYLGRESQFYKLLTSRFNEVEQKYIKFNNQYQKSIEAIVKAHKIDLKAFRKNVELSIDNKHLKVSKDVIAGILATIETEGEFFGDDGKATNKIQVFDNATKSKVSFTIAQDDVDNLKSKFTTAELEAIEEIKTKILNGELKSEYISFMEKTTGITPEVEEKYFMTQVDSGTATIDLDKSLRNGQYLTTSGWGRSKERINHNKTFKVNGFFASTSDYIQDLSYRVNFTDYLDEMRMFLNAQFKDSEGHAVTNNQLIAEIIPNWEGAKGLKNYMLNILLHTKAYDDYDFVDKLTSGYQMATLGLNVSSIAKQLLSDFTTMGDVGFKNWFASKKRVAHNVKNYKQVKEHLTKNLEIFRDRVEEKGYIKGKVSSNNVAKSEWNNIISKTMFLMEKTDEFNNIVNVYSVAETVAKNEGFGDYGTETNSERATEIFLNLLLTTQSNNYTMYVSPLRAGYMGKIARIMFGMFASDNQNKAQLVNRIMTEQRIANERREIYEAMPDSEEKTALLKEFDSEYSDKNYHKKVVGTVAAFALNAAFLVLISEAIKYLTGKKDKDEPFFRPEELKSFGFELFANWIPYIGTFSNAIENNTDVSFFTVDKINSLINSISAITNSVKTGDANKIRTTIIRVGMNTSELFGIPMSNLYKYSSGIVKLINEEAYYKGFNWYNAFTSNTMSSAFKTHVQRNNFTSAVEDLSAWYSLYKTGENDRAVLLSIAKLYQNYSNIIAKNIPDYYFNESDDKVDLTSNQRSEFYSAYKRVNAPVREVLYSNYTDEVKAKVIKKLYDAYYEASKYSVLKVEPQSKLGKLIAFSKGNIDSNISNIVSAIQLINNQPNKSKDRSISFINKFTKLSKVEKLLVLKLSGYSLTETNENQVKSYLSKLGLTREEINKIL